ncbi:MAG: rRNA maturation RNase YbeY [Terracidiphilus sp.]
MILLDPDLDSHPAPKSTSVNSRSASASRKTSPHARVPSARTLFRFLSRAQSAVRLRGRVSVLLTTDKALRRLNRQFRGLDKPTDVLSFPANALIQDQEKIAGDLAISVPTARRQSFEQGHPLATEIRVLILHGLLHLAGYDHETDSGQMARRERRLRAQLGLPQGLIERAQSKSVLKNASPATKRREPQVRGPQRQVFAAGVEVSLLRPGKAGTSTAKVGRTAGAPTAGGRP